jgi:hypothetical protein
VEVIGVFAEVVMGLEHMHSREVVADLNISRIFMKKGLIKLGFPTQAKGTIKADIKALALVLYSLCTR